jgi:ketosteroid isomerase-like protein
VTNPGREIVRWTVEPLQRDRRGTDERLALAAPWLRRRLTALLERAPAGSSLRRAALTRAVRTGYAAVNRDDYEVAEASLHPEIEFIPPGEGRAGIGFDAVYRGPDGVTRFTKQWKSGFTRFRYEPREIADAGGPRFAVRLGLLGTMRGSGAEVRDEYGTLVTLSGGLVLRQRNYFDWEEALEALRGAATAA